MKTPTREEIQCDIIDAIQDADNMGQELTDQTLDGITDYIIRKFYPNHEKDYCQCLKPKPNYPEMIWCDNCSFEINQ